jgi:hypothetical protein
MCGQLPGNQSALTTLNSRLAMADTKNAERQAQIDALTRA